MKKAPETSGLRGLAVRGWGSDPGERARIGQVSQILVSLHVAREKPIELLQIG